MRRKHPKILIAFLSLSLGACANDSGKKIQVAGTVKMAIKSEDSTKVPSSLHYVDKDGTLRPIETPEGREHSFGVAVTETMLQPKSHMSPIDEIASMGLPLTENEDPQEPDAFARASNFDVRFVAFDLDSASDKANASFVFKQFMTPFRRSAGLSSNSDFGDVTFDETDRSLMTLVTVEDSSGNAIEGASVFARVSGKTKEDEKGVSRALWETEFYRPIRFPTDADGQASVFPIPANTETGRYQIIASAPGKCTYASPKLKSANAAKGLEIVLHDCKNPEPGTLVSSFPKEAKVFPEEVIGGDSSIDVLYSNGNSIALRLDKSNQKLRPLKVSFYEGQTIEGGPTPVVEKYETFRSEIVVTLPLVFASTKTPDGDFIIVIEEDTATDSAEKIQIHGRKKTSRPDVSFVENAKIFSVRENHGIVSGIPGSAFAIHDTGCIEGETISISVEHAEAISAPCEAGVAKFKSEQLGDAAKTGGAVKMRLYKTDRYGNTSEDDVEDKHEVTIGVDSGVPDLVESDFGTKFGIVQSYIQPADPGVIFLFPAGEYLEDNTTDTIILTEDTVSDFVLRFAAASLCQTNRVDGDGDYGDSKGGDSKGALIDVLRVFANPDADTNQDTISCASGDGASVNSWPLKSDHLTFPAKADGEAYFHIAVQDYAGNASKALKITIPPCPDDVETVDGTPICWR